MQPNQQDQVPLHAGLDSNPSEPELSTLSEDVTTTIMRDVKRIGNKLKAVLVPSGSTIEELRDWDLWGPLFLGLALASILSHSTDDDQAALVFTIVFSFIWVGAGVVTLNAALLGGQMFVYRSCLHTNLSTCFRSFLQSLSLLGYCIAPLTVAAIVCRFVPTKVVQLPVAFSSMLWACRASFTFLSALVPAERRFLALYPAVLFFLTIVWLILLQ